MIVRNDDTPFMYIPGITTVEDAIWLCKEIIRVESEVGEKAAHLPFIVGVPASNTSLGVLYNSVPGYARTSDLGLIFQAIATHHPNFVCVLDYIPRQAGDQLIEELPTAIDIVPRTSSGCLLREAMHHISGITLSLLPDDMMHIHAGVRHWREQDPLSLLFRVSNETGGSVEVLDRIQAVSGWHHSLLTHIVLDADTVGDVDTEPFLSGIETRTLRETGLSFAMEPPYVLPLHEAIQWYLDHYNQHRWLGLNTGRLLTERGGSFALNQSAVTQCFEQLCKGLCDLDGDG